MEGKRTGSEKSFSMPDKCPSCGTSVEWEDVFCRCPAGLDCPAQVKERIAHYASKGAVDIDGFSDKTVEQFYEEGLIRHVSDIYVLKAEDILSLDGWKEKKADNLLNSINKAKTVSLSRFIFGLGIRNVGSHIAALLANKFGSIENLANADEEELVCINEIGPEIASCIIKFFQEPSSKSELETIQKNGVLIQNVIPLKEGIFLGKKIVFTGSLKTMSRSEAKKLVEREGGIPQVSVSSDTDIVVAGEKAGSKLVKARQNSIKIISETEFNSLIA